MRGRRPVAPLVPDRPGSAPSSGSDGQARAPACRRRYAAPQAGRDPVSRCFSARSAPSSHALSRSRTPALAAIPIARFIGGRRRASASRASSMADPRSAATWSAKRPAAASPASTAAGVRGSKVEPRSARKSQAGRSATLGMRAYLLLQGVFWVPVRKFSQHPGAGGSPRGPGGCAPSRSASASASRGRPGWQSRCARPDRSRGRRGGPAPRASARRAASSSRRGIVRLDVWPPRSARNGIVSSSSLSRPPRQA